jgi:ABC-type multidrug transport system fused ATPase/permease subunit
MAKLAIKLLFPSRDNSWLYRLWDFSLKSKKLYFYTSLILMFIEVIFDTMEPYALGQLIKLMSNTKNLSLDKVSLVIFKVILILFFNRLFEILKDRFGNLFNINFAINLQKEYYLSLLKKDLEFYDKNKISNLFSIISNDISIIGDISVLGFVNLLKQLIQSGVCIIMLFLISKNLCVLICIFVPLIALLNSCKKNYLLKKEAQNDADEKSSNNVILETLENIKIIKSFSSEEKEEKKYYKVLNILFISESKIIITCAILEGLMLVFFIILGILTFEYGLYLIQGNSLSIDNLTAFFLYCKIIYNGFFNVVKFIRNFTRASILADKLFNILDYEPRMKTYFPKSEKMGDSDGIKRKIDGNIELKNINFEYSINDKKEDSYILKNINLNIMSGMSIGIVGLSGSGKSTLISLIQRLYDIDINSEKKYNNNIDEEKEKLLSKENIVMDNEISNNEGVFYDNINVKKYDLKYLHSQIGYVQQEPSLFNGTIYENIIYGLEDDEIDQEKNHKKNYEKEIEKCLLLAQADFIFDKNKFPLGLDTKVGERGSKLSGGQKQRIAIARALIKKPKILILDEATSALDSESEFKFKKEIDNLKGTMTIIIISHRLSTIKDCDQIIVIKKGKILEKGKHEELYKLKGIYYNLMEKQMRE